MDKIRSSSNKARAVKNRCHGYCRIFYVRHANQDTSEALWDATLLDEWSEKLDER